MRPAEVCAALLKNLRGCFDFAILHGAELFIRRGLDLEAACRNRTFTFTFMFTLNRQLTLIATSIKDPLRTAAAAGAEVLHRYSLPRHGQKEVSHWLDPCVLQIFRPALGAEMLPELQVHMCQTVLSDCYVCVFALQVFLHLMLDLTNAERSLSCTRLQGSAPGIGQVPDLLARWQRATSLEFLRSVCEATRLLFCKGIHGALCSRIP